MQWLAQICEAVAAAHHAGVVHGDLTPNNILLDKAGRIVVTDFGFSTRTRKNQHQKSVYLSRSHHLAEHLALRLPSRFLLPLALLALLPTSTRSAD